MKTLAGFGLAFWLVSAAFGQYGDGRGGMARGPAAQSGFGSVVNPGGGHGFGNVVFPGAGKAPVVNPFSITDTNFANSLAGTVSGFRPYTGGGRGTRGGGYLYIPYAYPVYPGGYYGDSSNQQPNVTVVYPPQPAPVIINQFTDQARPVMREYSSEDQGVSVYQAPSRPSDTTASTEAAYYLIAFKDHSIYSAVAYWVEGDTLHYFTSGNTHNQASLTLVDRQLTEQLNRERNVDIRLPNQPKK